MLVDYARVRNDQYEWLGASLVRHHKVKGEQGWRSGESTRLPPMWSGFDSRTRRQMWVEFVERGAGMAQWWEHSPPTNVIRVRLPDSTSLCRLSLLLVLVLAPRGFSRVIQFSPLPKNQHFQIPIDICNAHVNIFTWNMRNINWFFWFDFFDFKHLTRNFCTTAVVDNKTL